MEHSGGALTIGGELRAHDGRHFGEVISGDGLPPGTAPDHTYYDYHPRTLSSGLFAREEWTLHSTLLATADLGWRHQGYQMRGDHFDGIQFDQLYDFATPRLGLTWTPRPSVTAFAAWAHARREPAFRDLYDAEGAGSVPLYAYRDPANNIYRDPLVRPERVQDYEVGAAWRGRDASATVNLFRMDLRDELVYAGQFNTDLGYPILGNAAQSVHQGVELAARLERSLSGDVALTLDANTSLSDHHFVEYRERYGATSADEISYDGNALGFFPAALGNVSGRVAWNGVRLGADARYIGRIYLDQTESRSASIAPVALVDAIGGYSARIAGTRVEFSLRVFNLLDREYETSGYMDYDADGSLSPRFVPGATRSVLGQVRMEW